MKTLRFLFTCLFLTIISFSSLYAQDRLCQAIPKNLVGKYVGDCKFGLPNGEGEAKGSDRYVGWFENGIPNGKGIYYYGDSMYYKGNFQDGVKEGKGEMHYLQNGKSDSVVKGQWSADIYRGSKYTPYKLTIGSFFDRTEVIPSDNKGSTVTFEIATTSGSPNGAPNHLNGDGLNSGYVLTLSELTSPSSSILKMGTHYASAFKSSVTYELLGFPCQLVGILSNGETFQLDLYKSANWKIRFFVNK